MGQNGVRCWCQHCGKELEPSHTGKCESCGKTGKRCEVVITAALGLSGSVAADINRALPKKEKPLWRKMFTVLKDEMELDGLEIGFPSGIKVIFKRKMK